MDGKQAQRQPTEHKQAVRKKKKVNKLRFAEYYGMQAKLDDLYQQSHDGQIFNKLMTMITSEENIAMAYRCIKRNTGSKTPGTDKLSMQDIEKLESDEVIRKVRNILSNYNPRMVRRVEIPKPNGKTRPLGIPCIWDRLIQQCILQVLEPICEAKFFEHSYGFRPLRSAENAVSDVTRYIQRSHLYYMVEIDIKGFFDNVNHTILIRQMWNMGIRDKQLLCIIKKILKAKIQMPDGNIIEPTKGTPQGGIISPLLANICLNDFDWHMESQWSEHPLTAKWKGGIAPNGTPSKGSAFREMRKTNLKELHVVRYADDVRILCATYEDASKVMYAAKEWLKKRLRLDVSDEKTKVTNLRKKRGEFLGFTFKAIPKRDTFTVESHMCDKAIERTVKAIREQVKNIEHAGNPDIIRSEISKYNSLIRGVHGYYQIATHISKDCQQIHHRTFRTVYNRLHPETGRMDKHSSDYKRYGKAYRVPKVNGVALLPTYFCAHHNPLGKKKSANLYTMEGRATKHEKLTFANSDLLNLMASNPIRGRSLEYNDNRLSLFAGQAGRCGVTGIMFLDITEIHCHHKIPLSLGGNDKYSNLILVLNPVHKLIHAKKKETIESYMLLLNLNEKQLEKLNTLRCLASLDIIRPEKQESSNT